MLKLSDKSSLLLTNKKQPLLLILLIFMCIYCQSQTLFAEEFSVAATDDLQQIIDASNDGDTLMLSAGQYFGNFVITKQITLRGEKGSIIDAQGNGHALVLKNSHITIDNLNIVNWGHDLTEQSSGIYSNEKVGSNSDKKIVIGLVISQ